MSLEHIPVPVPLATQENHVASRNSYKTRVVASFALGLSALYLVGCGTSKTEASKSSELDVIAYEQTEQLPHAYDLDQLTFSNDPKIIQVAEPLKSSDETKKLNPKGVTLHWWSFSSGGDIEGLREALASNDSCGSQGCAVQYAVTEDGSIYRMMESPTEYASHARGANETTFGIEIEGTADDFAIYGPNFNAKKFEAVVSLTRELINDFDMPVEGEAICHDVSGVHGHHEYNDCGNPKGSKTDVGQEYTTAVINAVYSMSPTE